MLGIEKSQGSNKLEGFVFDGGLLTMVSECQQGSVNKHFCCFGWGGLG
jgi:hypothetical protein